MTAAPESRTRVAIVGGGLAGLAAAARLAGGSCQIDLFEARRRVGGRATSFTEPAADELIDHCQHVSMGCCTALADFCRRTEIDDLFRRDRELRFYTRDGRMSRLRGNWLPAPMHLVGSLWRLHFLSLREKYHIARTMLRLARTPTDALLDTTAAKWLTEQGESARAIELFWSVVLNSALGETVDRASMWHARKVFVDGFLSAREAYEVYVPTVPLSELYGQRLLDWLSRRHVAVSTSATVERVEMSDTGAQLTLSDGVREFDAAIVAVPWHRVSRLLSTDTLARLPELRSLAAIEAAPITAVHLWFDRQIMQEDHAVLVGMLGEWVFHRPQAVASSERACGETAQREFYYQVVISGSHDVTARDRAAVVEEICAELASVWPHAKQATLLRWKMVTDTTAVFSVRPGIEAMRPPQETSLAGLFLAGDWTRTGWPATMESAVRSGYLAADGVLRRLGETPEPMPADLPRAGLARWIIPSK